MAADAPGIRPQAPPLLRALGLHMALHLRRSARLRVVVPALLLALGMAVAAGGLASSAPGDLKVVAQFFETFALRAMAIVALALGTGAIRSDAEHGALASFMLRPRAAVALPVGRLLAAISQLAIFSVLATVGIFAGAATLGVMPDPGRLPFQLAAALGAALSYTAIFVLLGTVSRHAIALGLGWLVIIDMGLGNLSDRIGLLAPHNSLVAIASFDPDLSLVGSAGVDLWLAVVHILALSTAASALMVWRMQGDVPD
jgi:ABC-2 type transport system permease protein